MSSKPPSPPSPPAPAPKWPRSPFSRTAGAGRPASAGEAPDPAPPAESPPPKRSGPLPSLAELGAFDQAAAPSAPPKPRLQGKLTDQDLAGLAAMRVVKALGKEAGKDRGQDGATPTPSDLPSAPLSDLPSVPEATQTLADAGRPASPGTHPSTPAGALPTARPATGVSLTWQDLEAAVKSGMMTAGAARALWAKWLAHKPLAHGEAGPPDTWLGEDEPVPGPTTPEWSRPEGLGAVDATALPLDPEPVWVDTVQGEEEEEGESLDEGSEVDTPNPVPPPLSSPTPPAPPQGETTPAPSPAATEAAAPAASAEPFSLMALAPAVSEGGRPPRDEAHNDHGFSEATPGAGGADRARARPEPEPEILEPLEQAHARRAAEAAAPRVVQVVDVIEVDSLAPKERRPAGWMVGQVLLALLVAVGAALSMGLGSSLFGPWGAAAAAAAWTVLVWRQTGAWHRRHLHLKPGEASQMPRALLGAHLCVALVGATVWLTQIALGQWPDPRPQDLFADLPEWTQGQPLAPYSLDWRWVALSALPMAAGVVWLLRLRHPVMLLTVTALLWALAFQAVAAVLASLGMAFHGLTTFMILLGALTLAAALYIDLASRRARMPDFALWPYVGGAVLLGAGWLSLAPLPWVVTLLRYAAWSVFLVWALGLQRSSVLGLALLVAVVELAWTVGRYTGSDLMGWVTWALSLGGLAGLMLWLSPRLASWTRWSQWWMPREWRRLWVTGADPAPSEPSN